VAKYNIEVDELRTVQDAKNKRCNAKVQELVDLQKSDYKRHGAELSI
jgi:hypothetical protein